MFDDLDFSDSKCGSVISVASEDARRCFRAQSIHASNAVLYSEYLAHPVDADGRRYEVGEFMPTLAMKCPRHMVRFVASFVPIIIVEGVDTTLDLLHARCTKVAHVQDRYICH